MITSITILSQSLTILLLAVTLKMIEPTTSRAVGWAVKICIFCTAGVMAIEVVKIFNLILK